MSTHRFQLRLPEELYEQVAARAKRDERSVNAQIVYELGLGGALSEAVELFKPVSATTGPVPSAPRAAPPERPFRPDFKHK